MKSLTTEVAIVGGGIIGASTAMFLAMHRVPTVLLEGARCGSKASGVNYGGVRRQGRTLEQLPLAERAHAIWGGLRELIGTNGEYRRTGHLKLARTPDDLAELERYREATRDFGMNLQILNRARLAQDYGCLGSSLAGGSLCPEDGSANPRIVSPAFAWSARQRGAVILEDARVTSAAHDGKEFVVRVGAMVEVRARFLVNAAGAWANDLAKTFGEAVPATSIHPQMMVTEPMPQFLHPSLGMQGAGIYARQVERGNVILGGGRTTGAADAFAKPERLNAHALLERAAEVLPGLQGAHVLRFWSGVEGQLPDNKPVIGPSVTTPGLFHAFGFCGAGFQIGPAVGEALAELIATGRSRVDLSAFGIERLLPEPVTS